MLISDVFISYMQQLTQTLHSNSIYFCKMKQLKDTSVMCMK